eukprot:gnl/MRDRNA2_/MRDRNA2_27387_c0_seq1.p1 gnl/MRDRNA2_/MRDRNA2_27387_c0~~gnl/MRDRNA2_/MRDRNA2_27387_c0_seq1.p1  ORF type:complete len:293 (-),score=57.38 gnl/MRDRNA2_/MRDRNA2_27387_c0_seq1:4-792(-)
MQSALSFFIILTGVNPVQSASAGGSSLRSSHLGSSFVKALEFKHRLRVCNAYPYAAALDVFRGKEKLTAGAMAYKGCEDFKTQLKAGDKLEFKVGDANAGTFSVSDLPNNDAVLLLVIYRHDTLSTAVSFESHVFANLLNAQIAVIDTYKGSAKSQLKIVDDEQAKTARAEDLRYDSVVAVNPGMYQCLLEGTDGASKGKQNLVALNRESYVILRVGVEAQAGQAYPQELVVYPKSDPALLHGGASSASLFAAFVALIYAFC